MIIDMYCTVHTASCPASHQATTVLIWTFFNLHTPSSFTSFTRGCWLRCSAISLTVYWRWLTQATVHQVGLED